MSASRESRSPVPQWPAALPLDSDLSRRRGRENGRRRRHAGRAHDTSARSRGITRASWENRSDIVRSQWPSCQSLGKLTLIVESGHGAHSVLRTRLSWRPNTSNTRKRPRTLSPPALRCSARLSLVSAPSAPPQSAPVAIKLLIDRAVDRFDAAAAGCDFGVGDDFRWANSPQLLANRSLRPVACRDRLDATWI